MRARRRARSAAQLGLELIEGARELASGVYVVAPFRQPLNVVDFLPALQPAAQSPVETGP